MLKLTAFIFAALVVLILAQPGYGQATNCTVSGKMYRPDGSPAAGEVLTIVKIEQGGTPVTPVPDPVTADGDGFVSFTVVSNSTVWVKANNVVGLNKTDGVPLIIPSADSASLETLWQAADGVTTFNTRKGEVTLTDSDVTTALGYTPADGASTVSSVNGRTGPVTLTSDDVTSALGYTPISPGGVIAAINSSPETQKIADSQLSPNIPRLNVPNTFGAPITTPGVYGGSASNSTLTLAGTSSATTGGANITLNGGGQGNVLVGTTTDASARLLVAGAAQPDASAVRINQGTGSASALDIYTTGSSTTLASSKALRFFSNDAAANYQPRSYFNSSGAFYTNAWMVISGYTNNKSGSAYQIPHPSTDQIMLGIWSDIAGPALQIRGNGNAKSYLFSGLNATGKYVFSVEEDGRLQWGAATRAGMDTNLYRSGAGVLRTGGDFMVDGRLTAAGLGLGTSAPAGDALLDLSGGDTKGLRLRPTSFVGPPTTGTWSSGTIILDSLGTLYICTTGGTPGAWQRAVISDSSGNISMAVGGGIRLQTPGTPFSFHVASAVFSSIRDDVSYWGYNLATGTTNTKINPSEPMLKFGMESHYLEPNVVDGVAGRHLMEYNFDYMSADSTKYKRFMAFYVDRNTHLAGWNFRGERISLSSDVYENYVIFRPTDGLSLFGFGLRSRDATGAGYNYPIFRPTTPRGVEFGIMPNGAPGSPSSTFALWNTDYLSDQVNYERLTISALPTGYKFAATAAGTGVKRSLIFQDNALTINPANNYVGVNTANARAKLDVSGIDSELWVGGANSQTAVIANTHRLSTKDVMFGRNLRGTPSSDSYNTVDNSSAGYNGIELRGGGDLAVYGAGGATTANANVAPVSRLFVRGSDGGVAVGPNFTAPLGQLHVVASNPAAPALIAQASAGQTANLLEARASDGTAVMAVDKGGHVVTAGGTPLIAPGAGAGTSPSVNIRGTDTAGLITFTVGNSPAASAAVATISFATPYAAAPNVLLVPASASSAALTGTSFVYVDAASTSGASFTLMVGSAGLAPGVTYSYYYHVIK